MEQHKLFDGEYKFMEIIWENEPINSTNLVKLCLAKLGWKKSTTYTTLRKLCEKGILENKNANVISLVKKDMVQKYESEAIIKKTFGGSLPKFISAFLGDNKLSKTEADEIKKIIEEAIK